MNWPKDTPHALNTFLWEACPQERRPFPTDAWLGEQLKLYTTPYPLTLAWSRSEEVKRIRCHKRVGDNLIGTLERTLDHYGSYEEVKPHAWTSTQAVTTPR
jgi:hypothetical protein